MIISKVDIFFSSKELGAVSHLSLSKLLKIELLHAVNEGQMEDRIIIIKNKKLTMHLIKENYLQIKYESKKGLMLNWNFKDLQQIHIYYHHLLILVTPRGKLNQNLLEQYYKRMKFGDLIGFAYINNSQVPKLVNWTQKTQLAGLQIPKIMDRITKDDLSMELIDQLIESVADWTRQNNTSNVVANFIFSESQRDKADLFVQKIIHLRQERAFSYHCGMFNLQWYNKISFNSGIHFLNTQTKDIFQVLSLYHSIINSAAVRSAKVSIDCFNGQMMSYDTHNWQNTDFSRIQRTFYGPSVCYQDDLIQFHVLDAFQDAEFDMAITLDLVLFSGQIISNNKRLKISFLNERHYDKSLNLTTPEPLLTYQGVELKSNPFSTSTFVRLMRSSYQDFSEIKEKLQTACKNKRTRQRPTVDRPIKSNETNDKNMKNKHKPIEYFYPNKHTEQNNQQYLV